MTALVTTSTTRTTNKLFRMIIMPNQHIITALNTYISNPDPRYALMIKGKWGCGKTYLVKEWIKDTFEKPENKSEVVLEPIKISLYGLTDTEQITRAIDRQLHPFLYSKAAKIGAGILKIAGKVVLRTDFDVNNKGNCDATLSTSLDSLSFLASNDEDIKPDSLKLLVFDDLERSFIPMKQLLGYINYFVENCGCHLIIIGEENKVSKEDKIILDDFKEKTVGKEFEVEPDLDSAISQFIDEIPIVDWLNGQRGFIKKVFAASQCNNLRILRQCLYDFKQQYNEADDKLVEKDRNVMKTLLGSFIAVYCEYKGENKKVFMEWKNRKSTYSIGGSTDKDNIEMMLSRYHPDRMDGINVMNGSNVSNILDYITRGISIKSYIDDMLTESQKEDDVLTRLENFRNMDNDVFEKNCKTLSQDLLDGKYRQLYTIGKSVAYFSFFEKENLYQVERNVIEKSKETIKDILENEVKDAEMLYQCRMGFRRGIGFLDMQYDEQSIIQEVTTFINGIIKVQEAKLPNKMKSTLLDLNDENVMSLVNLDQESTPDHRSSYNLLPVLKGIDSTALMERIKKLRNTGIREFAIFLSQHFLLDCNLGSNISERFTEDKEALITLKEKVEQENEKSESIRKWAFQYLHKVIIGCIKRCEGEKDALNEFM